MMLIISELIMVCGCPGGVTSWTPSRKQRSGRVVTSTVFMRMPDLLITRHFTGSSSRPDLGEGTTLRVIVVRRAGPRAGVPKDGNRADQRFYAGSLVVESSFGLSAPE
ncbi:hypothetical protein GCM10017774_13600 [Lentzea cavernae]|uniref:Secreted protein n=1 Tax=Lentzea cavernae TaxID=2020703 RepID=A0ABQ3M3C2_9PSEU|nr:hypothetical protein GCM10017774_13600 [Lentzea cavernae]